MIVVSDTTPLIGLASIGRLELLWELFEEVYIPQADWVLMDEKKGRRKLAQLNIPKIGTLGVLLKAKQLELIPLLRPEIEELQKSGFSISPSVVDTVLEMAGE